MDKRFSIVWRSICVGAAISCAAPIANAAAAPDPMLADQWALATPSAIGAREAWSQSTGAGVVVAVLDTGVQLDHPDLAANIWTNPGEIAGNGIDDDKDGIVDDVHGANMFDGTNHVDDDNGHGTHNAGIIAARQDNGIGGSGIAPDAKIMPVKILDSNMGGNTDLLAAGIRYAVDRGAKIINTSVNTDSQTETVDAAIAYAAARGAIIVASAGNQGRDIDLKPSYPASSTSPAVFSVAAEAEEGSLWDLSNTGLLSVDIAAPGKYIVSTALGSGYQSRTGTSAAAPFVAGSLALLSAARPDLPMSALRAALTDSSKRTSLLSSLLGGGALDVGAAMHTVLAGRPWRTAGAPSAELATGRPTLSLRVKSKVRARTKVTLKWTATAAGSVSTWRVSLDGRVVKTVPVTAAGVSRRVSRAGTHRWRVVGFDANGAKVVAANRAFKVVR
jgi:subtilisin family serine protease